MHCEFKLDSVEPTRAHCTCGKWTLGPSEAYSRTDAEELYNAQHKDICTRQDWGVSTCDVDDEDNCPHCEAEFATY